MKMRNVSVILLTFFLGMGSCNANAAIFNAGFKWTGELGYTVEGSFSYEGSSPNSVYAYGISQIQGLDYLAVSFYDPGQNLLFSTVNVSEGNSVYDSLIFNFDTVAKALVSSFDMGRDSQDGDFHLSGGIGGTSKLIDYPNADTLDMIADGTSIITIDEPPSISLIVLAVPFLVRRSKMEIGPQIPKL